MIISTSDSKSKITDFISLISGQEFNQNDITSSVRFLAALVTVLVGVIIADREIRQEETKRLMENLYRFSKPDSNLRKLTHSIYANVRTKKIYRQDESISLLAENLSEPEKLLLIAFGYDMSAADGDMDIFEQQYLEKIANLLAVDLRYLAVLEASFSNKDNIDTFALDEVRHILDPARFHDLDVAFIKATNDMLAILPTCHNHHETKENEPTSYHQLQKFQQSCKQLENYCHQLYQIVRECNEYSFVPDTFLKEIGKISQKLQSQSFRIAVVGEFSQGKSTLLNALLGEEIQPVRAIPCSGTVTVLKYGSEKRVICRYKDNREEEIPFEQYHDKAAISEAAALDGVSDELATSEIKEIIFEHPDLELCRHGVEIVDSPGLNEHPERTSITQQLIKDTDAVIFLTNASRPLTQGERELIQDLRLQLNGGRADIPADNLFILVNFMDLLRREKDRESVQERVFRFAQGDNPIIAGENRIHFISAQATLDAIIDGYDDEYLNSFNSFTQSIETFLTDEIGKIKIRKNISSIIKIIELFNYEKHQFKQNLLEDIGVISSWDIRFLQLTDYLKEETSDELVDSWNTWVKTLGETIYNQSEEWSCTYEDEEKILKFYSFKFNDSISKEVNIWLEDKIKSKILKDSLVVLDEEIASIQEAIEEVFNEFNPQIASNLKKELQTSLKDHNVSMQIDKNHINTEDGDGVGFGFGLGGAGLVTLGLLAFTGIGLIPIALTALGSGLGIGKLFGETKEAKIKRVILNKGLEKFYDSQQEIVDKVLDEVFSIFKYKMEISNQIIREAILTLENMIKQQESLNVKSQQLEKIHSKINAISAQAM